MMSNTTGPFFSDIQVEWLVELEGVGQSVQNAQNGQSVQRGECVESAAGAAVQISWPFLHPFLMNPMNLG